MSSESEIVIVFSFVGGGPSDGFISRSDAKPMPPATNEAMRFWAITNGGEIGRIIKGSARSTISGDSGVVLHLYEVVRKSQVGNEIYVQCEHRGTEEPLPHDFLMTFPVRIIVFGDEIDSTNGRLLWKGMAGFEIDGVLCVPVFTDADLVERFCKSHPIPGIKQAAIVNDASELIYWLENAKKQGFEGVALDPSELGKLSRFQLIDATIEHLR